MRYFSLIVILLQLLSCARQQEISPHPVHFKAVKEEHYVSSFNRVEVSGAINVNLHSGYKQPLVILRGDPRDLAQIIMEVSDNKLVVNLGKGLPHHGAVSAEIRGRYLNSLTYTGSGTINASNLHSGLLDLSINNSGQTVLNGTIVLRKLQANGGGNIIVRGIRSQHLELALWGKTKVELAGVINLSKLNLEGDGMLSMYWVKSPLLTICETGRVFVQLAGVVDKLDVELWDAAHFNGRYLRAKNAFVKTHDRAIAELTAVKHQHTMANDTSDIYFYKIPDTKADFMNYEGAVLDMRDWHRDDLRDYDRYNK